MADHERFVGGVVKFRRLIRRPVVAIGKSIASQRSVNYKCPNLPLDHTPLRFALKLASLEAAVRAHAGQFYCERLRHSNEKKVVEFRHRVAIAGPTKRLPDLGRLRDFYETFGSVVFYVDDKSGDAAKRIAQPAQWEELHSEFTSWFEHLDEAELAECMPEWIDTCLVIGDEPKTGNYLLMPAVGDMAGHVFLFDHDGFDITDCANDLVEYVEKLLEPNDQLLLEIATHMRFIDGDPSIQWWIREVRDNRGNVARTYV